MTFKCAKCGYSWDLRTSKIPQRCPKCDTRKWNYFIKSFYEFYLSNRYQLEAYRKQLIEKLEETNKHYKEVGLLK